MGTQAALFGAPNQMGLPMFSSTLTILGGTGIFSGATGLATATGVANPPSGVEIAGQVTPLSSAGRLEVIVDISPQSGQNSASEVLRKRPV